MIRHALEAFFGTLAGIIALLFLMFVLFTGGVLAVHWGVVAIEYFAKPPTDCKEVR